MSARVDRGFSGRCLGLFRAAACLFPASALAGGFVVAPTDLQFGSVFVNDSASIAVVIANVSGIPQMPNFAGGAPFDQENFGGFQNCAGVTLASGGSCAFTYVFHPASIGLKVSSTTIGIDDQNFAVALRGNGVGDLIFANGFD